MTIKYDLLVEALRELQTAARDIRADLRGVDDAEFGAKLHAALDAAEHLLSVHLPAPRQNVALLLEVLFRAVRNIRPPPVDADLEARTDTRDKIRQATGNLRIVLDEAQDAANAAFPGRRPIRDHFKTIADYAAIENFTGRLDALQAAMENIDKQKDTKPDFVQQGEVITVSVRDTRLVIDLARLHLKLIERIDDKVNETQLDLGAIVTTVETMNDTAVRLRDTFRAWIGDSARKAVLNAESLAATCARLADGARGLGGMMEPRDPAEPEMVLILDGSFMMGIPEEESEREGTKHIDDDARPVHRVTIRRAFLLGRYPVTNDEYAIFARETNQKWESPAGQAAGRLPVRRIEYDDALAYLRWLSERTGHRYRLPSEAEWEYACRAGTPFARYWGDAFDPEMANPRPSRLTPVDRFPPNRWGLHDMLGNALEWVEDQWHDNYLGAPDDGTAWVTGTRPRVLRGGAWGNGGPGGVRAGDRGRDLTGLRASWAGFRVARTL